MQVGGRLGLQEQNEMGERTRVWGQCRSSVVRIMNDVSSDFTLSGHILRIKTFRLFYGYYYFAYVCVCVHMCAICLSGDLGGQKRVSDPLELEL